MFGTETFALITAQPLSTPAAPHFIGCWTIDDPHVSDGVIEVFNVNTQRVQPGAVGAGVVRPEDKQSLDLTVAPRDLETETFAPLKDYMTALNACFESYLAQWAFLEQMLERVHIGPFNIQKYGPGGHFAELHSERTSLDHLHRVLVWMTYLNDVDEAGETEFTHYGVKVTPRKGRTLIWPAEWTHAHRGLPVGAGDKYIITGWFHFPDD